MPAGERMLHVVWLPACRRPGRGRRTAFAIRHRGCCRRCAAIRSD